MNKSESITNLAKAVNALQSSLRGAIKDSNNPFFKAKYADLESCWDAIRGPLTSNGLCIIQTMGFTGTGEPTLVTTLMHTSGEWISGEQPICAKSATPQDVGSAYTYSRRYGLSAIVGLIQVDDDANTVQAATAPTAAMQTNIPKGDPGEYVVKFGKKYMGVKLKDIHADDVRNYIDYLKNSANKDNKPLSQTASEFIAAGESYIIEYGNQFPPPSMNDELPY